MTAIDDVKARLDIVDVVSQYASLNKSGRNFKALCPFHTEKTPSFLVFPDRQSWRCFGACATGGDAFSFVMRVENLDFGQSLRLMADRVGVNLPERSQEKGDDSLYQVNEAAAGYFHQLLLSPDGGGALAYLEGRGVNTEVISSFKLGLSPKSGGALQKHLKKEGFTEVQALEAGLLRRSEDSTVRDLFRGRLMFPIRDRRGRMAGFGGRSLDESQPKYLNSPRTPIFDKANILYGLDMAYEEIRKQKRAVVVEGYMDVLAAHQHGFRNVVASMGTALTEQQVGQLRGLASDFILALDPDAAGQEATLRSLESSWRVFERRSMGTGARPGMTLYQKEYPTLKIVSLPAGKDPDLLIREDPDGWRSLLEEATPLMDYLLTAVVSRFDLTGSGGKAQASEALFPLIAAMDNPYEQDRYFVKLAEVLGVSIATLEASVGRPKPRGTGRAAEKPPVEESARNIARASGEPLEEYTLALLLQHPELREEAEHSDPTLFRRSENLELFTHWLESGTIDVSDSLDEPLKSHLAHLLGLNTPPLDRLGVLPAFKDCLRRLRERHLRELKLQEELLLADEPQNPAELEEQILAVGEGLKEVFSQGQRIRLKEH